MNIDRKKILIFLCALWPGGGYMYFGMMKKGTLVMALFTAITGLTMTIGWKFLAFLLPVIWCYCFFDTFHVAKLPEEIREFEDQDCWEEVLAFLKNDPLKRFEEKRTLTGVLILLAALYTMIYGVFLPFFRWSEQFRLVRMALTAIPPAVIAVLLFMVGRNILQKEQDRKDAEAAEADVEESVLEEGNVADLVEAVLGAEAERETAEAEEIQAEPETEEAAEAEEVQAEPETEEATEESEETEELQIEEKETA